MTMKEFRLWLAALILPKGYKVRRKYERREKKELQSLPLPMIG